MSISVFIAACALFTAVYDGLKRRDVSPTSILNAATVDYTGENMFGVNGTGRNGGKPTTLNFDDGVWAMVFSGQDTYGNVAVFGVATMCIAFYKGNSMTVNIGVGGGKGGAEDGSRDGGGKTIVQTNFALPVGYSGTFDAMAAGAGGGASDVLRVSGGFTDVESLKIVDGTFKGWDGWDVFSTIINGMHIYNWKSSVSLVYPGSPACQSHGGYTYDGYGPTIITPNTYLNGYGGGAGYYDGGASIENRFPGGGGSCTPWCYPLFASDLENDIGWAGRPSTANGGMSFFRIDPTVMPSGAEVNLAEDPEAVATVVAGGVGPWTPVSALQAVHSYLSNSNCGIETGWVFR